MAVPRPQRRNDNKPWKQLLLITFVLLLFLKIIQNEYAGLFTTTTSGFGIDDDDDEARVDRIESPAVRSPVECDEETSLSSPQGRDFLEIAKKTNTDKVAGHDQLPRCLKNNDSCPKMLKNSEREVCRPWGHFYDTIYNRWLKDYSKDDSDPIQFLEIGFYQGMGFEAFSQMLPRAEKHSIEISCLEPGPRSEGKWPADWGNTASKSPNYESLREAKRLHCGDANDYDFLIKTWTSVLMRLLSKLL